MLESQVPGRGKEILLFTSAPELLSSHSKSQMQGLISIFIDMHPRGSLQAGVVHWNNLKENLSHDYFLFSKDWILRVRMYLVISSIFWNVNMTIAVLGLGYEIFSYSVIKRSFLTSTLAEEIPETKANLRSQALVFFSTFEYCTLTVFIIANFHRNCNAIFN